MPNALADETSPYLLQHKDNPVDWVPWSEQAFERAEKEGKLVFLSVGYSTCHWCHVMEHESFENQDIAKVMNGNFVCVKVDREERPDVDATYMAFVQATSGQGGWPMSVWLTPEGKPVFGGTYFPPEERGGRPGFPKVCRELARVWKEDRATMRESAERVMAHLRQESAPDAVLRGLPAEKVFGDFLDGCEARFDPAWGGWGGAPKFPRPVVPRLLLQLGERFGFAGDDGASCLRMVERTLRAMAAGGLHDHLGGGFHRYSVDRYWHVPHYEKMLYDQAQLAMLYLEAWQVSGDLRDREVAEGIFRYVLRDLRGAGGALYAAEDAVSLPVGEEERARAEARDPLKKEGAFWVWSAEEVSALLDPKAAALFAAAYGIEAAGNARPESDPHGELGGTNTLYRAVTDAGLAERFEMEVGEVVERLAESRNILFEVREKRPRPHRDDKVIAAWNGLMIGALARGSRVLDRPELARAAEQAAEFVKEHLWDGGKLWRSWRGMRGEVEGFAADYAFLIAGMLELHGVTGGDRWKNWALQLQAALDDGLWDGERAGYVMTSRLGAAVLMTIREDYDGAEPAPDHVAAEDLLKLQALTGEERFGRRAEVILRAGAGMMETQPHAVPVLLGVFDAKLRGVAKMDVRGEVSAELRGTLRKTYLPRAVFVRSEGPGEVIECVGTVCRPWHPAAE